MSARKPPVVDRRGSVATHGHQRPTRIVLHSSEGTSRGEDVAAYWRAQRGGLGAHFYVERSGRIVQFANSDQLCWAVYGHNTGSVHIEIAGFASWSTKRWNLAPRQMFALMRLLAYLTARWGIRLAGDHARGVTRHMDFHDVPASMYHHDPGAAFPFAGVIRGARIQRRLGW